MGSITKQFVSGYVEPVCVAPAVGCIPMGTLVCYDERNKFSIEQENKMGIANTEIFEYCIVNFSEDGTPCVVVGPEAIVTLGEEKPRDAALLKIGCRHADIINDDSEVQIRPFC